MTPKSAPASQVEETIHTVKKDPGLLKACLRVRTLRKQAKEIEAELKPHEEFIKARCREFGGRFLIGKLFPNLKPGMSKWFDIPAAALALGESVIAPYVKMKKYDALHIDDAPSSVEGAKKK